MSEQVSPGRLTEMFAPKLTRAEIAGMSDDALVRKVNYRRKKYRDVPVALSDEEIARRIKEFAGVCGQIEDSETGTTQRKGRSLVLTLLWGFLMAASLSLTGLGFLFALVAHEGLENAFRPGSLEATAATLVGLACGLIGVSISICLLLLLARYISGRIRRRVLLLWGAVALLLLLTAVSLFLIASTDGLPLLGSIPGRAALLHLA